MAFILADGVQDLELFYLRTLDLMGMVISLLPLGSLSQSSGLAWTLVSSMVHTTVDVKTQESNIPHSLALKLLAQL
jgi:hypothetical protein